MGIKVNMSGKEGSSAPLENLPVGKYFVAVTDGELKASTSAKNNGKPYYSMELTVQDGEYDGRKLFTNVMCFEGALYSMAQILKALDVPVEVTGQGESAVVTFHVPGGEWEENEIPDLDWFLGKQFVVKVEISKERTVKSPEGDKTYPPRNDVKSWSSAKSWKGPQVTGSAKAAAGKGGNPLLP
jgi:hypothetical protein